MRALITALILLLSATPGALAQNQQHSILRANYCAGYISAGNDLTAETCQRISGNTADNPPPGWDGAAFNAFSQSCAANKQKLQRIAAYLMAVDHGDPDQSITAMTQGRIDYNQCSASALSPQGQACRERCMADAYKSASRGDSQSGLLACLQGCRTDICNRAVTCYNMSFMPY